MSEAPPVLGFTGDAGLPGIPFRHHWNHVVGAGRANEGLRADWQRQLAYVHDEAGFRYVRFHGLFHDDMFVYHEVDSTVVLDFAYVDSLFDALLEIGVRPFVEFGFMPGALAREKATVFWWGGNGSPPTDLEKWRMLLAGTLEHWVQRYGLHEVESWYFEVWNEPNLDPFWRGTRSEYFELYRVTAQAVKAISPSLRVGGPSTSNFVPDTRFDGEKEDVAAHATVREATDLDDLLWQPVWLERFLEFCQTNALPVDFVSCHPYPTDWALDEHGEGLRFTRNVNATATDLALLDRLIARSAYPHAEIHLTEWSSSSSSRDHTHDYLQAATFVLKTNLQVIGLVDSLAYWTFTDIFEEQGGGIGAFHGGFGLLNAQGIPKPSMHSYRFLERLGDRLLCSTDTGTLTHDSVTGRVSGAFFFYPEQVTATVPASFDTRQVAEATLTTGDRVEFRLELTNVRPDSVFTVEIVDRSNANALVAWQSLGSPRNLSREQFSHLWEQATTARTLDLVADGIGTLRGSFTLDAWSIVSVVENAA